MNLAELKRKVFALIEEYDPENEYLTADVDLQAKVNEVVNQRMFELCRLKKIPKYVEMAVTSGQVVDFEAIGSECGYDVYQVSTIGGVAYDPKASNTIFKFLESGTAEIDCFVYPERITEKTKDKAYEFELSADVLEIMVYGVAADLLKADVSAEYGNVYMQEYEKLKSQLDPRYQTSTIYISGGYDV